MKLTKWDADERVVIKRVEGVSKVTFEVYARLPDGQVVRQRYNDHAKAALKAEDLKIQGINLLNAKNRNVRPSSIDSTEEGDYRTARDIVSKVNGVEDWSLTKVATWFAANYKEQDWVDTIALDAVKDFLDWKKKEGAKKNYLTKIRIHLGLLASNPKMRLIIELTQSGKAALKKGKFSGCSPKQLQLMEYMARGAVDYTNALKTLGMGYEVAKKLEAKGYVQKKKIPVGKAGEETTKPGSLASINNRFLNDITLEELDEMVWSESWDVSNSTRRGMWKDLHHFYEWASGKRPKRCESNPMVDVVKPPNNNFDPEAFTVEQTRGIMDAAVNTFDGELVPYFAIALFAGLRAQEITGNDNITPLTWGPENFVWDKDDDGNPKVSIRLRGKMAWRRTVLLPSNCVKWIEPYKKEEGLVCPDNFKRKYDAVRAVAGFRVNKNNLKGAGMKWINELDDPESKDRPKWIHNGCRHSALSYRLAIVEDIQAVCSWAGNSPRTFKSNYEALVTREAAKRYWAICP